MSLSVNSNQQDYINEYCRYISFKKNLAKNTIDAYKSDLMLFLKWLTLGNYLLLNIDRSIINTYLAFKLDNGSSVSTIRGQSHV